MALHSLKILYVGALGGTSVQRANALRRLGHQIEHISPYERLPKYWAQWLHHAGGFGIDTLVARSLKRDIGIGKFDLAHVDGGDVIGRSALSVIKKAAHFTSNYNADNPYKYPPPEKRRWTLHLSAVSGYDLAVSIRRVGFKEQMIKSGVRNPMLTWQCADEITHKRQPFSQEDQNKWSSDVVFVGTWMPGRDEFILELVERGVPISIYGPRWRKAPSYDKLLPYIKGEYLSGKNYTMAIQYAKIALVQLNGANNDLHTNRTIEIPAIGSVLCAPHTEYHAELYREDKEAIFFKTTKECADKCLDLLNDDVKRRSIAQSGHERTFINKTYNEFLMSNIVEESRRLSLGLK